MEPGERCPDAASAGVVDTAGPETLRPPAVNTSIARGVIVTVWSKRITTAVGGLSRRDCVAGETKVRVA